MLVTDILQNSGKRQSKTMKVSKRLWAAFEDRRRRLGWTQGRLMDYILARALFPESKLYKVLSAEMVAYFDHLSDLKRKARQLEQVTEKEEKRGGSLDIYT
jgi:glutamyl/glutaminyl-tRNA synthetase